MQDRPQVMLLAVGAAWCGASAMAAVQPIVGASSEDLTLSVSIVVALTRTRTLALTRTRTRTHTRTRTRLFLPIPNPNPSPNPKQVLFTLLFQFVQPYLALAVGMSHDVAGSWIGASVDQTGNVVVSAAIMSEEAAEGA